MGAHSSLKLSGRFGLGSAPNPRCDHCRKGVALDAPQYWHMHFCSSACMTAYQQRLAPETKAKISQLEASRESLAAAWIRARNSSGSFAMFAAIRRAY